MQRVLSTHCLLHHRLTSVWLDRIWHAGIPWIEIYSARQHADYREKAQINELGHWFRDSELRVLSLHSPVHSDESGGLSGPGSRINIAEPLKARRLAMVDEIKRALEIAEVIPFRYLVQHLGIADEEYDERKLDAAFSSLEEIVLFAKQRGVEVLLENMSNRLANAERLQHFNQITHLNLNFCFDSGHAHLSEGVENALDMMKRGVRMAHLHDNNGKWDQHLFPLAPEGSIPWRRLMTRLRALPAECPLTIEVHDRPELPNPLDAIRRTFDALEELKSLDPEEL